MYIVPSITVAHFKIRFLNQMYVTSTSEIRFLNLMYIISKSSKYINLYDQFKRIQYILLGASLLVRLEPWW